MNLKYIIEPLHRNVIASKHSTIADNKTIMPHKRVYSCAERKPLHKINVCLPMKSNVAATQFAEHLLIKNWQVGENLMDYPGFF
jgi:hypothetical protein